MTPNLRVSLVQTSLIWEDALANRAMLHSKLLDLAGKTDLVILPEMFSTGFSMRSEALAEPMDGPTVQWMKDLAVNLSAALVGSMICKIEDAAGQPVYVNRLIWAQPDGKVLHYDKKNLFGMAGETEHFTAGSERLIVSWKGWRICPLICYDLRFPEWSRNSEADAFDLLLYVANWPNRRAHHWKTLLAARAIENQCFVIGLNILGKDGTGLEYSGDSGIFDYGGQPIVQISAVESVVTAKLSTADMYNYRQQLPFLRDSAGFYIK